MSSLSIQYYIFVMTRALVRCESVLSQLVFDHALRLRMKDGTEETEKTEEEPIHPALIDINVEEVEPAPGKPITAPAEPTTIDEHPDSPESTEVGSSQGSKKGKAVDRKAEADKELDDAKGQGVAGKINVLIAADVSAVVEGE